LSLPKKIDIFNINIIFTDDIDVLTVLKTKIINTNMQFNPIYPQLFINEDKLISCSRRSQIKNEDIFEIHDCSKSIVIAENWDYNRDINPISLRYTFYDTNLNQIHNDQCEGYYYVDMDLTPQDIKGLSHHFWYLYDSYTIITTNPKMKYCVVKKNIK
jgi:hypothetical protein